MEYNENFFGAKQDVYNNAANDMYLYSVGTKNTNAQAALIAQDLTLNNYLPDDIFYWMIGKDSPYGRYTLQKRTGSGGAYTWDTDNTGVTDRDIPIVLTCKGNKHNSTTINIDVTGSGSYGNNYDAIPNRYFIPSTFAVTGSPSYPIWFETDTLSASVQTHQTGSDFIVDFDYNNIIAVIQVNGSSNGSTRDLANYNNTSDNYIYSFGYSILAGVIDDNNNARIRTSSQTRYIDNTNVGTTSANAAKIVTDYHYKTASVMDYYNKSEFALLKTLDVNTHGEMILDGSLIGTSTSYAVNYYMDTDHWELSADGSRYQLIKHGNGIYNDDDFNYIRKCIAFLGFWFSDGGIYTDNAHSYTINRQDCLLGDNANSYDYSWKIPDKVYQAEIKNGITTGNFTELRIAKDNDQSKWGADWREKNGYEGRDKISPTDESSKSSKTMYESTFASFGRIYKCFPPSAMYPNGTIQSLADQLRSYMFSGNYDGSLFYNQNPVDCIVSIKEYPFDISNYIETLGTELIQLGRWRVQTSDRPELYCPFVRIKSSSTPIFYGSLSIPSSFKTIGYEFLDYEPYSKYDLYLPFCGTINIPSALAVETLIEVLYFIDLLSGCCIAHIYIDNKYYCSAQGQVAVEIPVSGYQIGNYTRDMLNATYAQKQAYANIASDVGRLITGTGGSIIGMGINSKVGYGGSNPVTIPDPINPAMALFSGTAGGLVNAGQIISGAGKAIQAGAAMASHYETIKYNKSILSHSAPAPIKSSLGGGIINWESPYYVEMLVQRPIFMADYDEETYKATLGKACYIADTLANHSGGYVEAINCNLSGFPATQPEKVELAKLLADGVFL